ncbi:MAG: hypothetical protein IT289_11320 [Oligoflexia bacterium]|nr:hypothetical protein [Oligoflexia bacterium]
MPFEKLSFHFCLVILIFALGCNSNRNELSESPLPSPTQAPTLIEQDPRALAASDLRILDTMDTRGPRWVDSVTKKAYSKVFGGHTGSYVLDFFKERIKHSLSIPELAHLQQRPPELPFMKWEQDAETDHKSLDVSDLLAAFNIGSAFYLRGAINEAIVTLRFLNLEIPITTPRVGIMGFGKGYRKFEMIGGQVYVIPPEIRVSILVHEARHSDCSTPYSIEDIQKARKAESARQFIEELERTDCGYVHTFCPKGHAYEGIPACDKEPWGAYMIGTIYAMAATANSIAKGGDEYKTAVLDATVVDGFSRILDKKPKEILNGAHGDPILTDTGTLKHQ